MVYDELCWKFISCGVTVAEILMTGYCLYRFAKPFMEDAQEAGKKAFWVGMSYSLVMLLIYRIPLVLNYFMAYGVGVLAAFIVMCRIDWRNYEQKAFVAVTFFALRWFTSAMAEILYDKLYYFTGNTHYMKMHPDLSFALYAGVNVFYLALEFLFTVIGIWCVLKNYAYKRMPMSKKELLSLTIPFLMEVTGCEIIGSYRNFYIATAGKNSDRYDMLSLLYYMVAFVTIVVMIGLYQKIKAGQEEKLQSELFAAQFDDFRQHVEQVENLYQDIRSIRHDMTNHLITLERLYAGNQTEEARAYSLELKSALAGMKGTVNSGNPVTDVILQEIQNEAEKRTIPFDVDFHYPIDSNVNAFDISVILNNALQNALEHAEKGERPFLSILSYRRNNAYMIEVRNRFMGELHWDTESGLPVTSKKKTAGHGYGLSNIRKVAEKYSGDIEIEVKDGEFCLSILLMVGEEF